MGRRTNAGRYRHPCVIERHNGALTAGGQRDDADDNWEAQASTYARIIELGGSELEQARQTQAGALTTVELRPTNYRPTPNDRLRFATLNRLLWVGRVHDGEDQQGRLWTCQCGEEPPL